MITACVNVRDDEATVERWVRHVAPHVSEVLVCDTGSVDSTLDLLRAIDEPKLRLIERPWTGFVDGRNHFFDQARTPVLLQLDVDELLLQRFWSRLPEYAAAVLADEFDSIRLAHFTATFVSESIAQVERLALDFDEHFDPFSYPRDVLYRADLPERGVRWVRVGGAEVLNHLDTDRFLIGDEPLLHCYPLHHKIRNSEYHARKIATYHDDLGGPMQAGWADLLAEFGDDTVDAMYRAAEAPSEPAHHSSWWAEIGRHQPRGRQRPRPAAGTADTIFVMIAAYRDPDLAATIDDALAQAEHPERLRFGVCVQDRVPVPAWLTQHSQVRLDVVDPADSLGVGWARSRAQSFYAGEDHVLQIDAHTRFEPGWDTALIRIAASLDADKPILTTYPCMFEPDQPIDRTQPPNTVDFKRFTDWGCIEYTPTPMSLHDTAKGPRPSRQFCAGFAFAPGRFVDDVPYDPAVYFVGEEVTMAARAFTHGYDLFHPTQTLAYHHYNRPASPKHWEDHTQDPATRERYDAVEISSRQRVRSLLRIGEEHRPAEPIDFGPFGLGSVRTLGEFEAYCGADLQRGLVEQYALDGSVPPDPRWAPTERRLPIQTFLALIDVGEWLGNEASDWDITIRDRHGTIRRQVMITVADQAQVLLTGTPELVVPYRAYRPSQRWELRRRDQNGSLVEAHSGDLRPATHRPSAVWG